MLSFFVLDGKIAHGRHHIQHIAGLQLAMSIGGEFAVFHFLYCHTQFAILRAGAYGIRPAHLGLIEVAPEGEVLPRRKPELLLQVRRYLERYRYTFCRFGPHVLNL